MDLVPPTRANPHAYRVGLHIAGGTNAHRGWYGVFSVDFPPDGAVHTARQQLDLARRSARVTVDGAPASSIETNEEVADGTFEATLALWRLDGGAQLHQDRAFSFAAGGTGLTVREAPRELRSWWRAQ